MAHCTPSLEFDEQSLPPQWGVSHRFDTPVQRGSPGHTQVLAALDNCRRRFAQLVAGPPSSDDQIRALRAGYTKLLWTIAPIRCVPSEVLALIFIELVFQPWFYSLDDLRSLNLTCVHWRNVALLTHRLWTSLEFPSIHDSKSNVDTKIPWWPKDAFSSWLSRSGRLPLSIKLSSPPQLAAEYEPDFMVPFAREFQRWRDVNITGQIDGLLSILEWIRLSQRGSDNEPKLRFPLLTALEIHDLDDYSDEAFVDLFSGFQAPKLTSLHMDHIYLMSDTLYSLMNGAPNLTSLHLELVKIGAEPDSLIQFKSLQRFKFFAMEDTFDANEDYTVASFLHSILDASPSLRILELQVPTSTVRIFAEENLFAMKSSVEALALDLPQITDVESFTPHLLSFIRQFPRMGELFLDIDACSDLGAAVKMSKILTAAVSEEAAKLRNLQSLEYRFLPVHGVEFLESARRIIARDDGMEAESEGASGARHVFFKLGAAQVLFPSVDDPNKLEEMDAITYRNFAEINYPEVSLEVTDRAGLWAAVFAPRVDQEVAEMDLDF